MAEARQASQPSSSTEKVVPKADTKSAPKPPEAIIARGTMSNTEDEATREAYAGGLDKIADKKARFFADRMPQDINTPGKVIVDVGSMRGAMAAIFADAFPQAQVVGVEVDSHYVMKAIARYGDRTNLQFQEGDISQMQLSADVYTISAVLHEIYSHTPGENFSTAPVLRTLQSMHDNLRLGGEVIIREPAMPDNPNEPLVLGFDDVKDMKHSGQDNKKKEVTHADSDLAAKDPATLTNFALFKRFVEEFAPLNLPEHQELRKQLLAAINSEKVEQTLHAIQAPAWVIGEFLRKRTFTHTPDHWREEMQEQNAPFTRDMLVDIARQAGFEPNKIQAQTANEEPYYGRITSDTGMSLTTVDGTPVDQAMRLPSHIYTILSK